MLKVFMKPTLPPLLKVAAVLVLLQQASTRVWCYTREDFPSDFIFGSGTSAYQVEGATYEDGRATSIVDTSALNGAYGGFTGDVACDEYHKYKEDVQLMVDTGLDAYRFSISWSRLIPNGRGAVNPKGLAYYNNLINELVNNGIQPHATLLHFDLPQALQDAYGGWLNRSQIVEDFLAYAEVCFKEFGDRVLYWTTINEPNVYGYVNHMNSLYLAGHNLLIGHASAVKLYRDNFQAKQQGFVGLTINSSWYIPETDTKRDHLARKRVNDFTNGWMMHPLVFGDYPNRMKQFLGKRLPTFTKEEIKLVKGSFDFIGLISYKAMSVKNNPGCKEAWCMGAYCADKEVGGTYMQGILEYYKQAYGNPPIYIYENGMETIRNGSLQDQPRIDYLNASIGSLLEATRNGSNVRGYFQWSFLDLFEYYGGYKNGYGLYYVDLNSPDLKRYPKLSAHWYSAFLKGVGRYQNKIMQQIHNSTSNFGDQSALS